MLLNEMSVLEIKEYIHKNYTGLIQDPNLLLLNGETGEIDKIREILDSSYYETIIGDANIFYEIDNCDNYLIFDFQNIQLIYVKKVVAETIVPNGKRIFVLET